MPDIAKLFPSRYLKVGDLDGKEIPVTIKGIKMENVGQSKESKPVAYFRGANKGLVLNVTNSKRIAKIAGSSDTDDWTGTKIILYGTETEFGGDVVECIRVKGIKKDAAVEAIDAKKTSGRKAKPSEPDPDDAIPEQVEPEERFEVNESDEDEEDSVPF